MLFRSMKVYTGSAWTAAYVSGAGVLLQVNNLSDLSNVATARTNLGLGTAATTASTAYATAAQGAKADTALQSYTETDPIFSASTAASITSTDTSHWNTSYGWGNHASAGYLTTSVAASTYQPLDSDLTAFASKTAPTGAVVGTSDSQTLSNKTIALGSNTVSGTLAQFNTAVTDADLASLAGSETLTNKTISGSSNTLSNIGNSALTNSSITINGSAISLGGTVSVGTVTSVSGSSPVASSGGTTPSISLSSGYGDTQNPYASKTANYVLAAPNGSAGVPTFRAIVAADIPTLNQNTTGSAGSVANALTIGTGLRLSSGTTYNGSSALTINAIGTTLNSQTSAYVVAASDAGKLISITTGGVTVNNSIMSAGDIVSIYNNSGSSQTITQGTGVTLQWAGQSSSTTGNRTLGLYGMATIVFLSASSAVITGSGLT